MHAQRGAARSTPSCSGPFCTALKRAARRYVATPYKLLAFTVYPLSVELSGFSHSSIHTQVKEEGWMAHHILIRSAATQELLACMPLYMKGHSYGEYVFDNSWAAMASRLGHRYYVRTL